MTADVVLTAESKEWPLIPAKMKAPTVLHVRGAVATLRAPVRLAIVGARAAPPWACAWAFAQGEIAARAGVVVVSGLALGIDAAAHRGALAGGGVTVAVLAHGLHMVFPAVHSALAAEIVATGGALVTEYAPGTPPLPRQFVLRDRIQAMLSDRVLLVYSEVDGGAMHTAKFARKAGIPVLVPPAGLGDRGGGVERLLQRGEAEEWAG